MITGNGAAAATTGEARGEDAPPCGGERAASPTREDAAGPTAVVAAAAGAKAARPGDHLHGWPGLAAPGPDATILGGDVEARGAKTGAATTWNDLLAADAGDRSRPDRVACGGGEKDLADRVEGTPQPETAGRTGE